MKLVQWSSPDIQGFRSGRRLAIVSTGPSYDLVDPQTYADWDIFALNAAITETYKHPNVTWLCHDMPKIWRNGFKSRLDRYNNRKVVSRREILPGEFGRADWREGDNERHKERFYYHMRHDEVESTSTFYWYSEFPDQAGYLLSEETVLERALEVATWWGYSPIVLVGVDMGPVNGQAYGNPWAWKKCYIKPHKFERMRKVLTKNRSRWPVDVFTTSPAWHGPFEYITGPANLIQKVTA
jgi:hypothetical protein